LKCQSLFTEAKTKEPFVGARRNNEGKELKKRVRSLCEEAERRAEKRGGGGRRVAVHLEL